MNCFEILGICETKDEKEIRKAYSGLLTQYSPEKDQEGFQRLRSAYEEALAKAREKAEDTDNTLSPADKFMADFENTYKCFEKRLSIDSWTELLDRDICCNIDTSREISDKILSFLMSNYNLPYEIWRLFDSYFSWSVNKKKLYNSFPKNFIDFVIYKINNKSNFCFEYLKGCREDKQDVFITEYNKIYSALDEYDLYTAYKAISAAEEICSDHPDLLILKGRYFMLNGQVKEADNMFNNIISSIGNDVDALFCRAELYLKIGRLNGAYDDYKLVLNMKPDLAAALFSMGKCCINLGKYEEAIKYMEKLISMYEYRQDFRIILNTAYNFHVDNLLKDQERNPSDINIKYKLAQAYLNTSRADESRSILEDLVKRPEASAKTHLLYCQVLMSQKDLQSAYEEVCRALDLFSDDYDLKFYKADILGDLFRYEESDALYASLLAINDKDFSAYNNRAYTLNKLKRYNEALKCADRSIELQPSMAHAYKNRAEALLELKLYEECIKACDQALNIYQYLEEAYIIKMKALIEIKMYDDASAIYSKACELGLKSGRLHYEKARVLMFTRKYDEALSFYDMIIQEDENNSDAYFGKGLCYYYQKNYGEAAEWFDKTVQCNPNHNLAYYYKAQCLMDMSKGDQALAVIDEALKLKLENPDNYYNLKGSILSKIHDYAGALAQYEEAIRIDPNYAYYYFMAGHILNDLNRYKDALLYFKTSIELDPNRIDCYVGMSYSLYSMQNYYDCIDCCNNGLRIDKDEPGLHLNKGWALYRLGSIMEAEEECNIGLRSDANSRKILSLKLRILRQRGLYKEALIACDRILELNKDDTEARNIQKELLDRIDKDRAKNQKKGLLKSIFK